MTSVPRFLWPLAVALTILAALASQPGANDVSATEAAFGGIFLFAFAAAGLLAWSYRPATRLGPLLTAFAFVLTLSALQQSGDTYLFTFGYLFASLPAAILAHITLAYPTGTLPGALERRVLVGVYAVLPLAMAANLLVYDPALQEVGIHGCRARLEACPESAIAVAPNADAFRAMQAVTGATFIVVAVLLLALAVRRYARASPRARRSLAPVLAAAIPIFAAAIASGVATIDPPVHPRPLYASYGIALGVFVAVLVTMMLRTRIGRSAVGDLVVELQRVTPARLRDSLARTLSDPSLELRFWLPERATYVDASGEPAPHPAGRGVTVVEADGEPLAALVHDPALADEPELLNATVAAARLALENARLQADLAARLIEVNDSRARIITAADEERRRVERNIHDGAQQRLVSLAVSLRLAARAHGAHCAPEVARVLDGAVEELQAAVRELRALAQGLHPSVLDEEGLAAALESLADRTPVPVHLEISTLSERLPPAIEMSAYFVACEAVTNAVKHADASLISIDARRTDDTLAIEIADDGDGAADADGTGLRGLRDRVAAHGGLLRVETAAGAGTRVRAELPCAS